MVKNQKLTQDFIERKTVKLFIGDARGRAHLPKKILYLIGITYAINSLFGQKSTTPTVTFFLSVINFVKCELPFPCELKSCTHIGYRTVNHAVTMCADRAE